MKCPNCSSSMLVTDETANSRSQVTFFRCSLCTSEHVSSHAITETATRETTEYFDSPSTDRSRYQMV